VVYNGGVSYFQSLQYYVMTEYYHIQDTGLGLGSTATLLSI